MPELLADGLPERKSRSRFDLARWANGEAWKFTKGEDYASSTETFRYNVKRWAKAHGYTAECRPYPALDADGNEIPVTKVDPVALGVRLEPITADNGDRATQLSSRTRDAAASAG